MPLRAGLMGGAYIGLELIDAGLEALAVPVHPVHLVLQVGLGVRQQVRNGLLRLELRLQAPLVRLMVIQRAFVLFLSGAWAILFTN